ncbi:MAG: hypothetical protein LBG91_02245 [Treponema sp.]|jgi:hypothetical protein|nr:hypothetical protein [Treponema sp.]
MEQSVSGKKQVEVLSVDGEKYVTGSSLLNALGTELKSFDDWFKNQKKKQKLVRGIDYIKSESGMLFSFEAATRSFEKADKPTVQRGRPRKSRYGYELDEYGLPILPPQKRRGVLINPYRI